MRGKLPNISEAKTTELNVRYRDAEQKGKSKISADEQRGAEYLKVDTVLVQQDKVDKFTTPFNTMPHKRKAGTCTFSVFGKARTISISQPNIVEVIHKYAEPGTSLKTYSVHKADGFWENVSRDLGVPNTRLNRKKILKAVLKYEKNEEDIVVAPKSPKSVGNVPLPSGNEDALQKTAESGIHTPDTRSLESDSKSSSSNANAKSFCVEMEKWKDKRIKRKGVYVSPLVTELPLKKKKTEVSYLWKQQEMDIVVSEVPCQVRGNIVIRHKDFLTLRPHSWLVGEVIESLLHHWAIRLNLGNDIYIMNHYTSGEILCEGTELDRRQSLSKVNFDNYRAILSFVNIGNKHWKLLVSTSSIYVKTVCFNNTFFMIYVLLKFIYLSQYINADDSCLYLVDPSRNSSEQEESDRAAKRFCDYFKMRRTCYNKTDWVNVRLRGGVLTHPFQQDGSSCGVMVIMMAKEVMEAFPNKPEMTFLTTKRKMAQARRTFAQTILEASAKPHNPGPSITDWRSSVITATTGSILNAWK
ncbi:uncharacterized protein LOC134624480 isoform X2 [Pelmatolapia mariae]|uniref:uncharacterized protein LOC134624480 isoform X2 n=1 Tax=Pelmatolapia mariae TaxID=158779 RepID=UPI002FE60440